MRISFLLSLYFSLYSGAHAARTLQRSNSSPGRLDPTKKPSPPPVQSPPQSPPTLQRTKSASPRLGIKFSPESKEAAVAATAKTNQAAKEYIEQHKPAWKASNQHLVETAKRLRGEGQQPAGNFRYRQQIKAHDAKVGARKDAIEKVANAMDNESKAHWAAGNNLNAVKAEYRAAGARAEVDSVEQRQRLFQVDQRAAAASHAASENMKLMRMGEGYSHETLNGIQGRLQAHELSAMYAKKNFKTAADRETAVKARAREFIQNGGSLVNADSFAKISKIRHE